MSRAPDRDRWGQPVHRAQPIRHPPPGTTGWPRKFMTRAVGVDQGAANRWAKTQTWWPRVITFCREAPCSTSRFYYWILKKGT